MNKRTEQESIFRDETLLSEKLRGERPCLTSFSKMEPGNMQRTSYYSATDPQRFNYLLRWVPLPLHRLLHVNPETWVPAGCVHPRPSLRRYRSSQWIHVVTTTPSNLFQI